MSYELVFGIIFCATVLYFVVQILSRGFKGAVFGARISRTVGEIAGEGGGMLKTSISVHLLEPKERGAAHSIGLELKAKSLLSYQMVPFKISKTDAGRLIVILQEAIATAPG